MVQGNDLSTERARVRDEELSTVIPQVVLFFLYPFDLLWVLVAAVDNVLQCWVIPMHVDIM